MRVEPTVNQFTRFISDQAPRPCHGGLKAGERIVPVRSRGGMKIVDNAPRRFSTVGYTVTTIFHTSWNAKNALITDKRMRMRLRHSGNCSGGVATLACHYPGLQQLRNHSNSCSNDYTDLCEQSPDALVLVFVIRVAVEPVELAGFQTTRMDQCSCGCQCVWRR